MKVGQIYCSAKNGNKARILIVDRDSNSIKIEWFEIEGKPCSKDTSVFELSGIELFVRDGVIRIYDELPAQNPNTCFRRKEWIYYLTTHKHKAR